jgi:Protein of unknown function (DUF3347)|tara:strand:+ start:151 stop:780 length:630 start_codon:yes stop_codon:yes gene_type:complete
MRRANVTTGILAIAIMGLLAIACKDKKKEQDSQVTPHSEQMEGSEHMDGGMQDHTQMDHDNMNTNEMTMMSSNIIGDYLTLKDALVSDDKEGAAKAGEMLESSLKAFDASKISDGQQEELKDIIEDATEHAEHIVKSDIGHQREHFDVLSKDVIDLLAITGSDRTLYQAYCPMYNNNNGGIWLSANREIQNPFFGSKMLTCGKVQKEIN